MSRWATVLAVALALAGCGYSYTALKREKDVAAPQNFRPKGVQTLWKISGHLESEFIQRSSGVYEKVRSRTLFVQINGEEVLKGRLSNEGVGEVSGEYGGLPVEALCSSEVKTINWMEVRCVIVIDNERTVTLVM